MASPVPCYCPRPPPAKAPTWPHALMLFGGLGGRKDLASCLDLLRRAGRAEGGVGGLL